MSATELLQKGRYRIDSAAAESGSNHLFKGYDTISNTKVFVKEIVVRTNRVTTLSQQENMRLAFENAAKRLTEFRHDSLLLVQDFYSEVGRQFLVLEGVDGDDLAASRSQDGGPFSSTQVLEWADQILEGLNYLHIQSPQVIHKRISPGNIHLTAQGRVKLGGTSVTDASGNELSTDLGRSTDSPELNYSPLELIWDSLDAASQKVIVSSYDDRSEKILKEPADVRSDIYSLGATIYFLLTGRVPVDPLERSIELLEGNPDPLTAPHVVSSLIAPEVSEVIMRAMEVKRENRYDAAAIMRQVLRTAVVRVREREVTELEDIADAQETLRSTQQLRVPTPAAPELIQSAAVLDEPVIHEAKPAVTAAVHAAPSGPSEAEILAVKLREAEEMRLEAERRAAEAERLLSEREAEQRLQLEEAARAAAQAQAQPLPVSNEDDLLGLIEISNPPQAAPVRTTPPAVYTAQTHEEDIHLSVKPDRSMREKVLATKPPSPVTERTLANPLAAPVEQDAVTTFVEPDDLSTSAANEGTFSDFSESASRSGLPIPLIGGAVAVLLLLVIGGWMMFGGSSSASNAAETEPAAAPVQSEAQNAVIPVEAQPETSTSTELPASQDQPVDTFSAPQPVAQPDGERSASTPASKPQTKATPAPKAEKSPEAAKTPAAKKVTVDDLINDN